MQRPFLVEIFNEILSILLLFFDLLSFFRI